MILFVPLPDAVQCPKGQHSIQFPCVQRSYGDYIGNGAWKTVIFLLALARRVK